MKKFHESKKKWTWIHFKEFFRLKIINILKLRIYLNEEFWISKHTFVCTFLKSPKAIFYADLDEKFMPRKPP